MREIKSKQTKIICGNNAEDFEMKLNKTLAELAELGASNEITFNTQMGYVAYIVYASNKLVAECKSEEYSLAGEKFCCGDCKYLPRPTDKRIKNVYCEQFDHRLRSKTSCACEEFYEALESAENFFSNEEE